MIPNAVDCEITAPIQPRDLHGEFSFPEGAKVVVAAGRLSPENGHRVLLEALAHLAGHRPPVALSILGAGAEERSLQEQARRSGLEPRLVIATSVGGTPEVVQNGRTGWLVPPGDASALAAAIVEAIDDETKAARIGFQAIRFLEEHFSFRQQTKNLVQVYESIHAHSVRV